MKSSRNIGVRWTIGDVSPRGFEALRLSIWGAWRLFGPDAAYAVCFNTLPVERVRTLTGEVPGPVEWHDSSHELPALLEPWLDEGLAEGVGWKFAPLRFFSDRLELSLDNDCILWELPDALKEWLEVDDAPSAVLAEDVKTCFGRFTHLCGDHPRNSGIRGLPAGFDLAAALRHILEAHPGPLESELDEQGLQVAALTRALPVRVVGVDEVSICSPFPPHRPHLGRCGAHFVGLNARRLPWSLEGRPATDYIAAHWQRLRPALYERVGISPARGAAPNAAAPEAADVSS